MAAPKGKKKAAKKAPKKSGPDPTDLAFGSAPLDDADIADLLKAMRSGEGAPEGVDDGAPDVMLANGAGLDVEIRGVVSTQCATLDDAIGRGGVPLGRLTILHGPEGCLAGDTMIPTNRAGKGQSYRLDQLVKMFNGGRSGGRIWDVNILTRLRAFQVNGQVRLTDMVSAFSSGIKVVFELTTESGKQIKATADHRFMVSDGEWKRLEQLRVGDSLLVEESSKPIKKGKRGKKTTYHNTVRLVNHPYRSCRNAKNAWDGMIVPTHRLVVEAHMNGVDLDWYITALQDSKRMGELSDFEYLDPKKFHVHHKDGDSWNNELDNLEILTVNAHHRLHDDSHTANLASIPVPDQITSIIEIGERETFDVSMSGPHNYIANGFVVHNCGKTTIALHLVAEVQRMGGVALYLDKEYKLDMDYAEKIGVDRSRLFLRQPDTLEEAFKFKAAVIRHAAALRDRLKRRVPIVIVLDSMNAAITKAQFEGDWDSDFYAPQARVYSKNLPRLMPVVYKEDVALIWISQVRKKMNVTFGNDEEIAGGNAPKFYASLIISIRRIGGVKKDDEAFGNVTLVKVTKNQVAPPFKKCQFIIKYGDGIDNERSILELGLKRSVVEKAGAWYSFEGERLAQGLDNSATSLREHPDLRERIWEAVKAAK